MKIFALLLVSVSMVPAFAQEKPAPKPPAITDAEKAHFWKAQAEYQQAQSAAQQANQAAQSKQVALQAAIVDLQKKCGEEFIPTMDPTGDPACVAKPKSADTKPAPDAKK